MYTDVSTPAPSQVVSSVPSLYKSSQGYILVYESAEVHISSRNTVMPESNILENKLFIVCMNIAGVFVSFMGIITHL